MMNGALVVGRLQVLAEVHLQRRLAVAEHVVGGAHARRDVVDSPSRPSARGNVERRRPGTATARARRSRPPGNQLHACSYRSAALQRQPVLRPLILHVEGVVARAVAEACGAMRCVNDVGTPLLKG